MRTTFFPKELENGEILPIEDPLEDEHWQFVLYHPAFVEDLARLREDLDHAYDFPHAADLVVEALSDPDAADYPALSLSEKWGIPPAAIISFAYVPPAKIAELRPEAIQELRQQAHGLVVSENPSEFVIRIPRPLTNAKREKLEEWVKNLPDDGPLERAWARVGKKESLSPALVEGIPWFERWNTEGIEPVKVWRDLTAPGGEYSAKMLSERSVYDRILGVWNRMRELSPDGIRSDKPSQRRG
jgi:hypothetical protein